MKTKNIEGLKIEAIPKTRIKTFIDQFKLKIHFSNLPVECCEFCEKIGIKNKSVIRYKKEDLSICLNCFKM